MGTLHSCHCANSEGSNAATSGVRSASFSAPNPAISEESSSNMWPNPAISNSTTL